MNKNITKTLLIVLIILVFGALTTIIIFIFAAKNNNQTEWDKENTRELNGNDIALYNSIQRTKDSLPSFITYYNNRHNFGTNFYAKIRLSENSDTEHIWVKIIKLAGNNSYGLLSNEPAYLGSIKYGDTVKFDMNDAEDLMIDRNDTIFFGAFTDEKLRKVTTYP